MDRAVSLDVDYNPAPLLVYFKGWKHASNVSLTYTTDSIKLSILSVGRNNVDGVVNNQMHQNVFLTYVLSLLIHICHRLCATEIGSRHYQHGL